MPHRQGDAVHQHLTVVREEITLGRRRRKGFGRPRPDRGTRADFAQQLIERLEDIQASAQRPAVAVGVRPHLVFRVPVESGAPLDDLLERLERAGLMAVSVDPDGAIIVFKDDTDLSEFRNAVATYREGPVAGRKSTFWDILEFIDATRLASLLPRDRIGYRLAGVIGSEADRIDDARQYSVDVELWHPGDRIAARGFLTELAALIPAPARIADQYIGQVLCLARVIGSGAVLRALLDSALVAEVELPPLPSINPRELSQITTGDLVRPTAPDPLRAPRICVVDSGISSGHPLLSPNIGHEESVLTVGGDAADRNGHGTLVAGIALYGDIDSCIRARAFNSPLLLFSARVLNDQNEFDNEQLIVNQMRLAIETFKGAPHNCRVFNLSLGSAVAARLTDRGRQTLWAEALDVIARELKVLLVVSAGNLDLQTAQPEEAERILTAYPQYLFDAASAICDPATAALAVTVGSIATADNPIPRPGAGATDISRAVAARNLPSPFSRIGPGLNRAVKPDFVAPGGNLVFAGFGTQRRIVTEPGTSVISLSNSPFERLFAFGVGTSLAAPFVARVGAITWQRLRDTRGIEPSPNLIRALLASSASVPDDVKQLLKNRGVDAVTRVCGYGVPDVELAVESSDRRVTLISEATIRLDNFHIYEVPLPGAFREAPGKKTITICLAYDPPVRRRRMDYLGVDMHFELVRGVELDDLVNRVRRTGPGDEEIKGLAARNRCKLTPAAMPRGDGPCRKRSTLQRASYAFTQDRGWGDSYFLVIRSERKSWLGAEEEDQDYAVSITLEGDAPQLYQVVRQRVEQRARVRIR